MPLHQRRARIWIQWIQWVWLSVRWVRWVWLSAGGGTRGGGSIVAREYGIPACLGVGNGTKRIAHGQTITLDGDAGTVLIHED